MKHIASLWLLQTGIMIGLLNEKDLLIFMLGIVISQKKNFGRNGMRYARVTLILSMVMTFRLNQYEWKYNKKGRMHPVLL